MSYPVLASRRGPLASRFPQSLKQAIFSTIAHKETQGEVVYACTLCFCVDTDDDGTHVIRASIVQGRLDQFRAYLGGMECVVL